MTINLSFAAWFVCIAAGAQTPPIPEWHLAGSNPKAYEATLDRERITAAVLASSE